MTESAIPLAPLLDGKRIAFEVLRDGSGKILDLIPVDPRSVVAMTNDQGLIVGWIQFGNPSKRFESNQILLIEGSFSRSTKSDSWSLNKST